MELYDFSELKNGKLFLTEPLVSQYISNIEKTIKNLLQNNQGKELTLSTIEQYLNYAKIEIELITLRVI